MPRCPAIEAKNGGKGKEKMLDLVGDFSLLGAPLKARISAFKTGHRVNNAVAKILLKQFTQDTPVL